MTSAVLVQPCKILVMAHHSMQCQVAFSLGRAFSGVSVVVVSASRASGKRPPPIWLGTCAWRFLWEHRTLCLLGHQAIAHRQQTQATRKQITSMSPDLESCQLLHAVEPPETTAIHISTSVHITTCNSTCSIDTILHACFAVGVTVVGGCLCWCWVSPAGCISNLNLRPCMMH